jgi:hypothetical protein
MKLINGKYITGCIAFLILSFTVGIGCDDPYENGVDYAKLELEEKELRMDFFNSVRDSLMRISTDSLVDIMEDSLWVSWELEKGSDDPVLVGKRVAFKYSYYYVVRDSLGHAKRTLYESNYGKTTLATYTVGSYGVQDVGVTKGLDRAIRHMYLHGKSFILMGHSMSFSEYIPIVAEIEIVSLDLD